MIRKKTASVANSPLSIVTDGVKISLRGNIPRQKRGYRKLTGNINLKYRGYGHQTFENVAEIFYKGEKCGFMELFPRSLMSPDTVLFTVDNRLQYSSGWTDKIKAICSELNLNFKHLCQLDIATDQPYNDQFSFIQKLINGNLLQVGNTSFSVEYEGTDKDSGAAKCRYFRFGSRASNKFMRAYYKRQELAISNKWYIQEWWKANNFNLDENQEVARFEMSLKRRELKTYVGVEKEYGGLTLDNFHLLENVKYLAAIFNTAKKGFFEFVSKRSFARTGNITRCARKIILDLSNISTTLLTKIKSRVTSDIYKAKIAIKHLYNICCKTAEPHYMNLIEEISHNFNLRRWFEANREKFYKEFSNKYNSEHFPYMKAYTSRPEFVQSKIWKVHNFTE